MQGGFMRLGFALPQFGSLGVPEAIVTVAKSAEDLGFDSLWVADRILWPVKPRVPYPTVDGALPLIYKRPLDPLEMLTFAAAHTRRIALGTEAQGWFPAGIPLNEIGPMFESIKAMGGEAGRNPAALELIIRANVKISDAPIQKDRVDFSGSLEQIAEDLAAARRLGAAEILIDVQFSPGIDSAEAMVARMEQFQEIARRS
jgi:alkanesulfonate monooxygenase SsuD/methylene tetrahydromethanopterin reductase-like flavin-dependent oxidoreductase (luciferase family)